MDTYESRYQRARARVQEIRGYWIHLSMFIAVNLFLAVINFTTSPNSLWFIYPLLGWGIGLLAHTVSVFGFGGFLNKDWEEKKIRELMDKDDAQSPPK